MQALIHAISTAVPPHVLNQSDVVEEARALFSGRYSYFDRLSRAFETAGIDRRHSVVPIDWFRTPHGWAERNTAYLDGARALFRDAATQALNEAGWDADSVDTVITVSTTGIATPSLEAQVLTEMGFRDDILRLPVFGLGCAGGVSGLIIAARQAQAAPGSRVLMVVVEACSVSFRMDRLQKADIIAAVLFGDGAAAVCLSTVLPATGPVVECGTSFQRTFPDTLAIMGWDVDDEGLGVVFDRSIPDFVNAEFAGVTARALKSAELHHDDIDKFVCHPGGAKVVEAIENTLKLPQGHLAEEREVLRRYGNMSAPTVLFVLKEVLEAGRMGQLMTCALGPGFTAAFMPLHVHDVEAPRMAAE